MATITIKIDKALVDHIVNNKDQWIEDAIKVGIAKSASDLVESMGIRRRHAECGEYGGSHHNG